MHGLEARSLLGVMAAVVAVFAGGLTMARSGAPANDEMARISAFEVANDLSTARIVYAGRTIEVQLGFEGDQDEPQTVEAQHGAFRIEYYPASVYDKQGVDSPGVVQLFSRLPRTQSARALSDRPPDIADGPPAWHDDLPRSVRELYLAFDELNSPEVGTLCDERLPATEVYGAMESGACYVWCTGFSSMTVALLRSTGTPARLVALEPARTVLASGTIVQSSESHQSAGRWDGDHWAWIEPSFRMLEVRRDGRTLSLHETMVALSDVSAREQLVFTRLGTDGGWADAPYAAQDTAFRDALARYLSADKQLLELPLDQPEGS